MKVSKIEGTKNYGPLFDVALPIRFFFNKDGTFDGIEVYVEEASERDQKVITELLDALTKAKQIE